MPHVNSEGTLGLFGYTDDIDIEEIPTDVWNGGGEYAFPAEALTTTVVSDSSDDASDGTGARSIYVEGLDANYAVIGEAVTMNGVTPVTLSNAFLRINDVYVLTAGTGETNSGKLNVKHSETNIAEITAEHGRIHQAIYTVPAVYAGGAALRLWTACIWGEDCFAEIALQSRPYGGAWLTEQIIILSAAGGSIWRDEMPAPMVFNARADMRVRVLDVSDDNVRIAAGLRLALMR